jgi:hypothetical protein
MPDPFVASKINLDPGLCAGLPWGFDDGEARLEQETDFVSLTLNWDPVENYSITAVTGYVDLKHWELDDCSYGPGVFGGLHHNHYASLSQEIRILSNYDDSPVNFQAGFYWQEIEQEFDAYQYAFNLAIMPNIFGNPAFLVGPDPVTGIR